MKSIKTLGLATAMALALVAFLGASTASADLFKAATAETTFEGSRNGSSHVLELSGESFTCKNVSFAGVMPGTSDSQVTTSPELQSCAVPGVPGGTNWAMNGCKFRFNAGKGTPTVRTVDIVGCTSPMSVNYHAYCKVEIDNQNGLGTVEYTNINGSKEFTVTANLKGITFTRTGGGYCAAAPGTFHNGLYSGQWTVKGSKAGSPVSVFVESTPPPPSTVFAAEVAPVTIAGSSSIAQKRFFVGASGSITCANYTLSGTESTTTTNALTLAPGYSGCTWGGASIPNEFITSGACSYVLYVNGTFDIAGANCAKEPIMFTRAGCVLTIGPQSGLSMESGSPYSNEGSGKLRKISMSSGVIASLTYTLSGPNCNGEGTFSNGNVRSVSLLSATTSTGAPQGLSVE